jgi:hypothetical protein
MLSGDTAAVLETQYTVEFHILLLPAIRLHFGCSELTGLFNSKCLLELQTVTFKVLQKNFSFA